MTADVILREIFRDIVIMFFLRWLIIGDYRDIKRKEGLSLLFITSISVVARCVVISGPDIRFMFKLIIFIIFVKVLYKKPLLYGFRCTMVTFVLIDLLNIISAICAFPLIRMAEIALHTDEADIVIFSMRCIWYILAGAVVIRKINNPLSYISKGAQIGVVLISVLVEFTFLEFKRMRYDSEDILLYKILLFVILMGGMSLIFWFIDKKEEQKRILELTSYAHKIREVIPSVGRMLGRLEELSDHMEKTDEIIRELRSICQTDVQMACREMSQIKAFDPTGSPMLDEQLKSYLEEAGEKGFNLDIIVMAPADEILNHEQMSTYKLLQMVGDLYRNAYKVVLKRKEDGNILICFGYNAQGNYEISIHDNAEPFPRYVLSNLGKRGVTTDGTGHGLADIFEVIDGFGASFVLHQKQNEKSIFTKGIRIVFDNQKRVEIKVR